jgi:hypothetical protein
MHEDVTSLLKAWESFYVIVGSTGGALTGLQFVVLTLIGEAAGGRKDSISAFSSPNVVHFCAALLVASILSAPWTALWQPGLAVAGCGVLGVVYSIVVLRRARRQRVYQPVLEDWVWHAILPILAYATLLVAGVIIERSSVGALYCIGAAVVLLVFIGIHNAWDTVTYVMMQRGTQDANAGAGVRMEPRTGTQELRGSDPGTGSGSIPDDTRASSASGTQGSSSERGE